MLTAPAGVTRELVVITVLLLGGCPVQVSSPVDAGAPSDRGLDLHLDTAPDRGLEAGVDAAAPCASHSAWTVGLVSCKTKASPGYTLFAPMGSTTTYLIDLQGRLVHTWAAADRPGMSAYLLESGNLLRAGYVAGTGFGASGTGGRVQELSWDGAPVWDFTYAADRYIQHHDIERLPGGNVVLIAWEKKTAAEAIAAGRDPALLDTELWVDYLVEIKPTGPTGGTVVWEWHIWDHLIQDHDPNKANYGVVEDHPELLDVNFSGGLVDWTHTNAVAYNAGLDQLVISVHGVSEVFVVDHGTTTAEAAGHAGGARGRGGDILYRWGNPAAYRAGTAAQQAFAGQHDAHWIAPGLQGAGDLLVFNNGGGGILESGYSTVDQITPPLTSSGTYKHVPGTPYGPAAPTWRYASPTPGVLVSRNLSSAQRLPGGNTLICSGTSGVLLEVTQQQEIVWTYINPVTGAGILKQGDPAKNNNLFRARRYPPSYPGLAGKVLTPRGTIEIP